MLPQRPTAQEFFRPGQQKDQRDPFGVGSAIAEQVTKEQPSILNPAQSLQGNWDYKTATTGRNGEPLPEGAKSWTPQGTPYFGDGTFIGDIIGKAKEYWWNF